MANDQYPSFSRYTIERKLSKGGMGSVYLALQTGLNRPVALKVPHHFQNEMAVKRFVREGETLAKLSHPNVVQVYDAGVEKDMAFLAMELIEGVDLEDLIKTERPSIQQTIEWGIDLADALQYIHSRQVIHRDIKNENIIINQRNQPILVDFGLSKNDSMTHLTLNEGAFLGTFFYAAPESFEKQGLTGISDIYSLGVVLYRCLTGAFPYTADSPKAFVHTILTTQYLPVHELNPEVPKALSELVDKCLEKNPEQRIQSGKALATALKAVRGTPKPGASKGAQGRILEASQEIDSTNTRIKRRVAPALAILALIVAGIVVVSLNYNQPNNTPTLSTETSGSPYPAAIITLLEAKDVDGLEKLLLDYRNSSVLTYGGEKESFIDPGLCYVVAYNGEGVITVLSPENEQGQRMDIRFERLLTGSLDESFPNAALLWVLLEP